MAGVLLWQHSVVAKHPEKAGSGLRLDRSTTVAQLLTAAALAGCGSPPPELVQEGPRLVATQIRTLVDAPAPARQAQFSVDGRLIVTTSASGAVVVRELASGAVRARFQHPGGATSVAIEQDARWLATGGYDGIIRLWGLGSGEPMRELPGARGTIWSVDISPDGRSLAAAGEDGLIRLWNLPDGKLKLRLAGHTQNVWEARFSPDGARLASGSFDNSVRLWNVATGKEIAKLTEHSEAVVGLAWSPDGRLLATGSDDSSVILRRASDGHAIRRIFVGNHVYKPAFTPDSMWLATAGRARGGFGTLFHQMTGLGGAATPVRLWRVSDARLVGTLELQDDVMFATFSPSGRLLATAGEDSRVTLWALRPELRR